MTIFTDGLRLGVGNGIDELHASMGEYLGAEASEAFENNPVVSLGRIGELTEASGRRLEADPDNFTPEGLPQMRLSQPSADIPDVSIEQARARVKEAGLDKVLHLPEDASIKAPALDIMVNRARERNERAATISRGPSGIVSGALGVGTSLLVSAIDPLNVAAAFIPVVGEVRYAKLMANAGESVIARAGVRAGVGAASGAVGMGVLEPLDYAARRQEGQDYGMADALRAVLYGAAFGGVLHTAGGGVADVYRGRQGKPLYPFAPGEAFERPADGQSGPGTRQNPLGDTQPAAEPVQPGYTPPAEAGGPSDASARPSNGAPTLGDVPAAQAAAAPDKPLSLHEFIAARGGVSDKDPQVADFLQSFGGKAPTIKGKGRLVSPDGKSLDEHRQAAVEAGYLQDPARESGGVTQSSIDDLLGAVDTEARGKVYPAGADRAPSRVEVAHAREEELAQREKFIVEARQDIDTALNDHELSDRLRPQVAHRALRIMQDDDIGPHLAVQHAMAEYGVAPSQHPVMAGLGDLPPRAREDVMRGSIASLINGEPVRAGEMLHAAAKTDPRIAESLGLWSKPPPSLPMRSGTEHPIFKEWFGYSKVVDADGKPNPVFHGTTAEFKQFDKSKLGFETGAPSAREAFFFTEDPELARSYGVTWDPYKESPVVNALNKVTLGGYEKFNESVLGLFGKSAKKEGKVATAFLKAERPLIIDYGGKEYREVSFYDAIKQARREGYDSVLFKNTVDQGFDDALGQKPANVWAVFEPDQIKIAKFDKADGFSGTDRATVDRIAATGRVDLTGQDVAATWHELAERAPDFDEPAIADASKAADAQPAPQSLAAEPSARVAAAEKSLAEAEAVYKANEDYIPDEIKAKLDHELAKLDVEVADRAEVIKRGAACLVAGLGAMA